MYPDSEKMRLPLEAPVDQRVGDIVRRQNDRGMR